MSSYGVIGYHVTLSEGHMIANHPIYRVIGYHVGHMITPYKETLGPHLVATLIYLSQNYSYYIRGDRSSLIDILSKHAYGCMYHGTSSQSHIHYDTSTDWWWSYTLLFKP